MEHIQLQIKKNIHDTTQGGVNNFRKEYQAADNNVYVISGREVVTVPHFVGIDWLAADTDLEQVTRS